MEQSGLNALGMGYKIMFSRVNNNNNRNNNNYIIIIIIIKE